MTTANPTLPSFHICVMDGYEAFREGILFCQHSLESLGYTVSVAYREFVPTAINIVFASYVASWQELSSQAERIIVYNWEQVSPEVQWFTQKYWKQMLHTQVWDYNQRNIERLQAAGIQDIQYVPLGYVPQLQQMSQGVEQDIDVLFYGNISPRRKAVLDALRAKGLKVVDTQERQLLGPERDACIARAKVVLNMHYYEQAGIFEVARVSYLLANRKAVVSELGAHTHIEDDIKQAIVHGEIHQLPDLCEALVKDPARCAAVAQHGFEIFSKRVGPHIMRQALDEYFARYPWPGEAQKRLLSTPEVGASAAAEKGAGGGVSEPIFPKVLQIGAGTRWRYDCVNLDADAAMAPDLVVDINQPLDFAASHTSWRFGYYKLLRGAYQKIIAVNNFQTFSNLQQVLTNCLALLEEGGVLEIEVPHEWASAAWADVKTCRCFNETTWQAIVDGWWRYGWDTHKFHLQHQSTIIRTSYGVGVLAEKQQNWRDTEKVPRAIDAITITLCKQSLTASDLSNLSKNRFGI